MSPAVRHARLLVNIPFTREEALEALVYTFYDDLEMAHRFLRWQRDVIARLSDEAEE